MLGRKNSIAVGLQKIFPNLIIWHCANHRVELAVHDTRNEVQGVSSFHLFFDKLYSIYSMSPNNQLQLNQCAWALGQRLCKIGKIFIIRWVASSLKTVKAVWDGYRPLENHFTEAATDATRDSKERAKYKGLCNILTSCEFIRYLGIMYDALTELFELSLLLQKREMTLPDADRAIKRTV
jgi:hypothetical protein